jgi:membrane protease YdiL (CAAX protease family)
MMTGLVVCVLMVIAVGIDGNVLNANSMSVDVSNIGILQGNMVQDGITGEGTFEAADTEPALVDTVAHNSDLTSIDIGLVIAIGILFPLVGWVLHKREQANKARGIITPITTKYKHSALMLWVPMIILLAAWWYQGRGLDMLGLIFTGTLANWIGLVVILILSGLYSMQVFRVRSSVEVAESVLKPLEGQEGLNDIIPTTKREYHMFLGLSVTAGITEEIMFRGFMIWGLAHYMPVWAAAIASLMSFTLAHLYQQSVNAIVRVFLMGLVLTLTYLLSGSLITAIILHIAVDMGSGALFWFAREKLGGNQ